MKRRMTGVIKVGTIQYLALLIYVISISAYQLTTGIDPWIVRISFFVLVFNALILKKKIQINKQIIWILLFWAYYFLSLLWARNKSDTMLCFNSAVQVILLSFCLPNIVNDKEDVEKILKYIIISLLYTSVLIILRTPINYWGLTRIGASTGLHPNSTGTRLATGALLCVYFLHKNNKRKKEIFFYAFCFCIFIVIALFTGSKKAVIIIIAGLFLYELLSSKGAAIIGKIAKVGIVVFFSFYIIMNNASLYKVLGKRIEVLFETMIGEEQTDYSYIERNFFIQEAKGLFKAHPILGYGGDNFMSYMREINYSHVAYSHNNYFELLSTLGIVGFILYYSIWVITIINLIKIFTKNNSKLSLLFLVIILINIILDYGNVTYYSDFNMLILILANLSIQYSKSIERKEIYYAK